MVPVLKEVIVTTLSYPIIVNLFICDMKIISVVMRTMASIYFTINFITNMESRPKPLTVCA